MNAAEKANELYQEMLHGFQFQIDEYTAKQCALIAVDEILNNDGFTQFDIYLTEYWQEVKQEIEKL